ncbi:GNAT family N-acetyltransferase [Lichenibacterium ramalinae]|uniref:N-acetyltransferase n=1 Tax=Lichenibacterium ramalinae TaxID=2316527 RepID=A0A4Q2RA09_9HYPH|nr:GNAT family N-acetyltransferase [Lichenibacterium ramalinae]RYB02396.1 N-acetyltransferase [Lichenibacterium ramalinae]
MDEPPGSDLPRSIAATTLRSDRLVLRPLQAGDAEAIAALLDDVEVVRWTSRIPHPYRLADAVYFLTEIAPRETCWGIAVAGGALAGVGGLAARADAPDVELGYWLGRPFWGRGYATEAAGLMLDQAWSEGRARVLSGYFDGNLRSRRVLGKLGFREVGRSTRHNLALGRDLPHVDMLVERPAASGSAAAAPGG